jgi:hypothetical protein
MVLNDEFTTIDTPLAVYLVQQGSELKEIRYTESDKFNRKRQGTFIFKDTPELKDQIQKYNRGEAIINLAVYERIRDGILDRLMRGLP